MRSFILHRFRKNKINGATTEGEWNCDDRGKVSSTQLPSIHLPVHLLHLHQAPEIEIPALWHNLHRLTTILVSLKLWKGSLSNNDDEQQNHHYLYEFAFSQTSLLASYSVRFRWLLSGGDTVDWLIGTLTSEDDDINENGKKQYSSDRFSSAKQQLCKCLTLFGTLCCSHWTLRYFKFHEGCDHKTTIVSFFF